MDANAVKSALVVVLKRVQDRRGLVCPPLKGETVPVKELEKFTSKIWPAATTWLARELNIIIPKNVHIFGVKRGAPPLTIDQAVELVCQNGQAKPDQALAAE
jgi:hypothetical protein